MSWVSRSAFDISVVGESSTCEFAFLMLSMSVDRFIGSKRVGSLRHGCDEEKETRIRTNITRSANRIFYFILPRLTNT